MAKWELSRIRRELRARSPVFLMQALSLAFWSVALVTTLGVPLYGWRTRGRGYATFTLVVLLLSLPGALIMRLRLRQVLPAELVDASFAYLIAAAGTHLAALVTPRLRHPSFRLAVSVPGMCFVGGGALSGLWLLLLFPVRTVLTSMGWTSGLETLRWLDLLPFSLAALSLNTSTRPLEETVRIRLARGGPSKVTRVPVERHRTRNGDAPSPDPRALRIVQITDPHLGPWQPISKLRRHIAGLLHNEPDLVMLTGDFLTMESGATPGALAEALQPLRALPGRCFAVFGNHDHAYPDEVRHCLDAVGVRLLVDEEARVQTASPLFPEVQVVGADWVGRGRRAHLEALLKRFPRRDDGALRVLLLHDPSAFKHVPKGNVDLTLSGHTHGGQLGLVSLGLDWTVLSRTGWPDHGLFGHGSNRLYVHRGTGFYGFPLRVGVPGEASVLEILPPFETALRTSSG